MNLSNKKAYPFIYFLSFSLENGQDKMSVFALRTSENNKPLLQHSTTYTNLLENRTEKSIACNLKKEKLSSGLKTKATLGCKKLVGFY